MCTNYTIHNILFTNLLCIFIYRPMQKKACMDTQMVAWKVGVFDLLGVKISNKSSISQKMLKRSPNYHLIIIEISTMNGLGWSCSNVHAFLRHEMVCIHDLLCFTLQVCTSFKFTSVSPWETPMLTRRFIAPFAMAPEKNWETSMIISLRHCL